ncbi:cupin domain-containing protein [Cognatilysobacter segetis]|uniref:cupin domain-containing protein n=1 Tax=Cognatilysobacter segetis TaxID=2492394 RepID=UPI001060869C|nr:cupin [Lysobacter segetis]
MSVAVVRGAAFTADRPWGARTVAAFGGLTANLHWTNAAYPWHVNDGDELFVVLAGAVEMQWREDGIERSARLVAGDVWRGGAGIAHRALPQGEARVLVVETPDADTLVDAA